MFPLRLQEFQIQHLKCEGRCVREPRLVEKKKKMLFTSSFIELLLQSAIGGEQPGGPVPVFVPPQRGGYEEFMACEQRNIFLQM